MHKVIELFGQYTENKEADWGRIIHEQIYPFSKKKCFKVIKSSPETSIGTCNVRYGINEESVIICPNRLLQNHKVFIDCLHLLHLHQPGNDIHIIPELSIPGGSVDFVVASVRDGKVVDFVGIEFQTLDTTGSVWQSRQEFVNSIGINTEPYDKNKTFGINWKMTAKTILRENIFCVLYLSLHQLCCSTYIPRRPNPKVLYPENIYISSRMYCSIPSLISALRHR